MGANEFESGKTFSSTMCNCLFLKTSESHQKTFLTVRCHGHLGVDNEAEESKKN